ncbi:ferredoxin [Streptomyces shenzhenensis]|uniref:Ferredoxin n=1 Tax=Streptomyces shenzhenensis TaxID=943815 RepID=A0A3M0IFS6_9ACTN|nr:ferredoxin [Streptomyces shenzhenensis]RMB85643.1 ferredoxin [Streptomyces shenzhenensis]
MTVSIDPDLCYGSGECAHRVPSVFAFEDGYGVVRPVRESRGDEGLVREAAELCPSQAITVTE